MGPRGKVEVGREGVARELYATLVGAVAAQMVRMGVLVCVLVCLFGVSVALWLFLCLVWLGKGSLRRRDVTDHCTYLPM